MAKNRWSSDIPTENGIYWSRWVNCPDKNNKVRKGVPILLENGYIYTTAMGAPFDVRNMRPDVQSEFYGPVDPPRDLRIVREEEGEQDEGTE